ncbi:MAG: phosphoribosylformylglycinamidine synthase [Candidatus Berkelbacteria bacterium]|nr:MAG: phosphoribosylformylglycinamidine synthase [Candidatus Berkelbacteria bacterium]QQG51509.1 MAG: phosphoribosylformylglycinamidine synthase [Candidatus Berkelbacteria bacterium]
MKRFYRTPALTAQGTETLVDRARRQLGLNINSIHTEYCYYVKLSAPLSPQQEARLVWLLGETFEPDQFGQKTFLDERDGIIEVGPRLNFETPFSSSAVEICHKCGLNQVVRLERSRRYQPLIATGYRLTSQQWETLAGSLHDRMTEQRYEVPLDSLEHDMLPEPMRVIPLLQGGIDVLRYENKQLGLGMDDDQDLALCLNLFVEVLERDPTNVELMQIAQANSEHCRHWFFKGRLVVDDVEQPESLMEIVRTPWIRSPGNSLIAFHDDSSAIKVSSGVWTLVSTRPGEPVAFDTTHRNLHPTLTAETHNMPSGKAPYPGAATGTGGRIRDNLSVGRAGIMGVAGAAYCVGNLQIPGFEQPWEMGSWAHPDEWASPLDILIRASDGASDYGNCFGEPVIYGFTRTAGLEVGGEWRSWTKPVMYTVGAGQIDERHVEKGIPQKGMFLVQLGGPAYRIGLGGGAASSMIQGENRAELDFNAVQRGNPEMEQRMWRVVQTCSELGEKNPIVSIHDLGAGGDCNALPELVVPAGARIELRHLPIGDTSLSVAEIWANESQEREALLATEDGLTALQVICEREGVPMAIVGQVTGDGLLILHDESDGTTPVALPLDLVLEKLPQKTFNLTRVKAVREPLRLPDNLTVEEALVRVLLLPAVASKRFLTTKVDRCVTGLVAQQQCIGPMHVTLADCAVMAQSHFETSGVVLSLGEQPMKGLISPAAMARLTVAEALLNMVGVPITKMQDIRCSANWMWAPKLIGEGAWLLEAAQALRDILVECGMAIDGGKDSLSMAAKMKAQDGSEHVVKAPGELVVANYAPTSDVTRKVNAAVPEGSELIYIDLGKGKNRLGGSALAQVYGQVGDESPDVDDLELLKKTFTVVQTLVRKGAVNSVHDRSDGGLIVTLLEMAFAGCTGLDISLRSDADPLSLLFSEEPGLILGCSKEKVVSVRRRLWTEDVPFREIGKATSDLSVQIQVNNDTVLTSEMLTLRGQWERTSTELEKLQADPAHAEAEHRVLATQVAIPAYHLTFDPWKQFRIKARTGTEPRVAILREQGSNSDREMAAAFFKGGFTPFDVTMNDLLAGRISLRDFRGVAFVGGFSFGDVLDAGKGWAGVIRFNSRLAEEFQRFYEQPDTFSLGVCNGCQLMALLGWVPGPSFGLTEDAQPRFIHNASAGASRQFESRFSTVKILPSPAIMLKDMEGSRLGIWVAHGEGRLHVPQEETLQRILDENLAPVRFSYPQGGIADGSVESYPFNPNGSPAGIAALCSPNGRHLAIMPHPERTLEWWNWPWLPSDLVSREGPWLELFQNARNWCDNN